MADALGLFEQAVLVALIRLAGRVYGRAILNEVQTRLKRDVTAGAGGTQLGSAGGQRAGLFEVGAGDRDSWWPCETGRLAERRGDSSVERGKDVGRRLMAWPELAAKGARMKSPGVPPWARCALWVLLSARDREIVTGDLLRNIKTSFSGAAGSLELISGVSDRS